MSTSNPPPRCPECHDPLPIVHRSDMRYCSGQCRSNASTRRWRSRPATPQTAIDHWKNLLGRH